LAVVARMKKLNDHTKLTKVERQKKHFHIMQTELLVSIDIFSYMTGIL